MLTNLFRQRLMSIARKNLDVSRNVHFQMRITANNNKSDEQQESLVTSKYGWGWRDRTYECRIQNPVPYHLAKPQ
jgi:hypothetical protein